MKKKVKVQKTRLRKLAKHLLQIAENPPADRSFNLHTWHCGSSACAVGEACLMPEFQKLGLRLVPTYCGRQMQPAYKDATHWNAVQKFFGLPSDVADLLFAANSYPTDNDHSPDVVAYRIEALLSVM